MNRIEEIDKEIEKLDKILEEKESNWDFTKEPFDFWYEQYLEYRKPESKRINELYRERRMIQPYTRYYLVVLIFWLFKKIIHLIK